MLPDVHRTEFMTKENHASSSHWPFIATYDSTNVAAESRLQGSTT